MGDKSKESRIAVRIDASLHNWVKMYAQRANKTMSILITEYLESLRHGKHTQEPEGQLEAQLEQADSEIVHLREQVSHLTQLLAIQTKNNASLTNRLQAIEDMRHRPWWRFWG